MDADELICVGRIDGPHGVRGLVKLTSYTETPEDVAGYGPLCDARGEGAWEIELLGAAQGRFIARIAGIDSREAAQALKGLRLHVRRAVLPEPEAEEYYHADLVGLAVEDTTGAPLGTVIAVQDFGAGDVLEIGAGGSAGERRASLLVPFTKRAVPVVDIAGGRLVVDPPEEAL
jgi:16S rRNA processing protein RimM